jgi:hypothetical protein
LAILGRRTWDWFLAQAVGQGLLVIAMVLDVTADLAPVRQKRLPDSQNVHIFLMV